MQSMTGGQALAEQLAREGVRHVFGVPGVQLDYAVDGLARIADRVAFWNTRHEQAASYMADGYARTTGQPGVCLVVPGPGVLNAAAGIATAFACSSRVLCLAGQIPSSALGRGMGMLHEIPNQSGILRSLTKWSAMASSPSEIPALVHEAMHQLKSGRPRPVALELPPDVLAATSEVALMDPVRTYTPIEPDAPLVRRAAELLMRAERPLVYAGGGVVAGDASNALRALAERLQLPVVMSTNGRGALDDRHPLALTSLAGRPLVEEADVVLAVGTRFLFGQEQIRIAPGAQLLLLNAEIGDLGAPRQPALALHADAASGLAAISGELDGAPTVRAPWADLAALKGWAESQLASIEPQAGWVRALRNALPEDGILVNEFTQVGYMAQVAFPVYRPRSYVAPGYQGTLGYGFPTALGAKAAHPDRPVLSIAGDGGFGWGLQELSTARKFDLGLVTVVFNDGAYGNVRRAQVDQFNGRIHGSELLNPDFVHMAESFSVRGGRATTPEELEGLLREALAGTEPVLIDVPVQPMPNPFQKLRQSRTAPLLVSRKA